MLVLAHGCFDILHIGHVKHLEAARAMGTELVVSITGDKFITKPGRPIFDAAQRAEILGALKCVDEVHISEEFTGAAAILKYRPAYFVKGVDYLKQGVHQSEADACNEVGAKIVYTETPKFSSTDLIGHL